MRAWLLVLSLPLAQACAGKSVRSGDVGTETSEQVEASLPSWCQSSCEMLMGCQVNQDCACSAGPCDCDGGLDSLTECTASCEQQLGERARISDACAQEIARFERCVDAQGCRVAQSSNVCPLATTDACDDYGGDAASPPPSGED